MNEQKKITIRNVEAVNLSTPPGVVALLENGVKTTSYKLSSAIHRTLRPFREIVNEFRDQMKIFEARTDDEAKADREKWEKEFWFAEREIEFPAISLSFLDQIAADADAKNCKLEILSEAFHRLIELGVITED